MTRPLLVEGLCVSSAVGDIVRDISFELPAGGILTLVGESGSGKSLVLHALMGTLPAELQASGIITWGDVNLLALSPRARRALWGRNIGLLPQEPWLSLNPSMRVGGQLWETYRHVRAVAGREASRRADGALAMFGLAGKARHYPFQLSGGMCQRVALAAARAGQAALYLVDEPTKGLDAARVDDVADALLTASREGQSLVVVTHDLRLAQRLDGLVAVMRAGRMLESGPADEILRAPAHPYTRELVAALPTNWVHRTMSHSGRTVVEGKKLAKSYGAHVLFRDVDVAIGAGDIVSLTGDSGTGKSTLGNVLLGVTTPDLGSVVRGTGIPLHGFQKMYQDPPSSFAPHLRIGQGVADLARTHGLAFARFTDLMSRIGLAASLLERFPHQLSGGELQRLSLARSLLIRPAFLFADEPTSRLDPLAQLQVIKLLIAAADEDGLAILLITHDADVADRVGSKHLSLKAPSSQTSPLSPNEGVA